MGKCFHSTLLKFYRLYDYLGIDSGGYLYEQPFCINCSMALCFPKKLLVETVFDETGLQGKSSVKRFEQSEDWILRYIRTYLYFINNIFCSLNRIMSWGLSFDHPVLYVS